MTAQIISGVIQLVFLLISKWFERNAERKQVKQEAANLVVEGIRSRDPSKITAGFTRVKNL